MKRLATEQAILLACSLLCASVVRSERLGTFLEQIQQLPAGKELPLQGVNGKLALLGSTELQVQELRQGFQPLPMAEAFNLHC